MTLLEAAEPIFQFVCRLNRLARCGGPVSGAAAPTDDTDFFRKGPAPARLASLDFPTVRAEVNTLLSRFREATAGDVRLAAQARDVELVLLFFLDSMIAESSLNCATQWNEKRLAYERNELAGDDKFFDLLEKTLKDGSEEASERLAIFYICIGLGFTGVYFRQPEFLRKTMLQIAPRIRQLLEADHTAKICPEAYEGVDTTDLRRPPGGRLMLIGLLFVCFTVAVVVTYVFIYSETATNLSNALTQILTNGPAAGGVPTSR